MRREGEGEEEATHVFFWIEEEVGNVGVIWFFLFEFCFLTAAAVSLCSAWAGPVKPFPAVLCEAH